MKTFISELKAVVDRFREKPEKGEDIQVQKDLDRVVVASRLLEISEFRFFKLAYNQWYGHDILDSQLEYLFADYMYDNSVPHWVRHLARRVLSLSDSNALDPDKFDIERPRTSSEKRSEGIKYTVLISIIVVVFCLLLTHQSYPY